MKQLIIFACAALAALAALSSCHRSAINGADRTSDLITVQLTVPESSIVESRAQTVAESQVNNLWIFTFDAGGVLQEKCKATDVSGTTAKASLPEGTGLSLYGCANVGDAQETAFGALTIGTAKVADLKAITTDRTLLDGRGFPMWGEKTGQTITSATTTINMALTRSCAKLSVSGSVVANFTLDGIQKLLKTATTAPLGASAAPAAAAGITDVTVTDAASIYLYENGITALDEAAAETNATAVIIRGSYKGYDGYYKLRVQYNTPKQYTINRNTIYSINITAVNAPGFATLAEAEANSPQNVDYTVTVTDADATDLTTSNGQYYLGVTNSEYVAYNSGALADVTVTTVTHNAPSSITAGTVTATGTGLTLKTTTTPTDIKKQEIKVDLAANFTSGTLTVRIGNLLKVINITKKTAIVPWPVVNSDFAATNYVQGVLDATTPTWLKLGASSSAAASTRQVQNPNGGLWLHVAHNVGDGTARTGWAYISSRDAKGRARVDITQQGAVLKYVSNTQSGNIKGKDAAAFNLAVSTQVAGWTVKAYQGAKGSTTSAAIKLGTKTGSPSLAAPAVTGTIPITVPNNPDYTNSRTIQLYLSCTEVPSVEIWAAQVTQEKGEGFVLIGTTWWAIANLTGTTGQSTSASLAANPQDYGMFFKWGDRWVYGRASSSTDGTWTTETSGASTNPATSGTGGAGYDYVGLSGGRASGDPCRALGAAYKTPTHAQWVALNGTGSKWGTHQGVNGYFFGPSVTSCTNTSIADGCIFIPAAGLRICNDGSLYNETTDGYYWSSSVGSSTYGYGCSFNSGSVYPDDNSQRGYGLSVRCVQE